MHRSGTSCLAGCLQERGLFLGDVVTSAPHNKKGNRENKRIYQLHEKVLTSNGASWNKPKVVDRWLPEQVEELEAIIQSYSNHGQWGLKDPRILFTLQAWLDLLPDSKFTFVASIRHPGKVAASLSRRDKFTQTEGFRMWELYNKQLLKLMDVFPVQLINFDQAEASYSKKIGIIAAGMLAPGALSEKEAFYEPQLINHVEEKEIPKHIETLYESLLERSL